MITIKRHISISKKALDLIAVIISIVVSTTCILFVSSILDIQKSVNVIDENLNKVDQGTEALVSMLPLNIWIADEKKALKVENTLLINSDRNKNIKSVKYAYTKDSLNPLFVYFIYNLGSKFAAHNELVVGKSTYLDSMLTTVIPKKVAANSQSIIITDFVTSSLIDTSSNQTSSTLTKLATLVSTPDNDSTFSLKIVASKIKE